MLSTEPRDGWCACANDFAAHSKKSTIHAARPDPVIPPFLSLSHAPLRFLSARRDREEEAQGQLGKEVREGTAGLRWAMAVTRSTSPSHPATRPPHLPLCSPADCAPFLISTHHRLTRAWRGGGSGCRPRGEQCEGKGGREGGRGAERRAGGASLEWILGQWYWGLWKGVW